MCASAVYVHNAVHMSMYLYICKSLRVCHVIWDAVIFAIACVCVCVYVSDVCRSVMQMCGMQ